MKPIEKARDAIADYLIAQILGPTEFSLRAGKPLPAFSVDGKIYISKEDSAGQFFDEKTGFPIIQNSKPEMVFGTGIIHSPDLNSVIDPLDETIERDDPPSEFSGPFQQPDVKDKKINMPDDPEEELSSIDQSQRIRPSAMGFTTQIIPSSSLTLKFTVIAATYEPIQVVVEDIGIKRWYVRTLHEEEIRLSWEDISRKPNKLVTLSLPGVLGNFADLQLRFRETKNNNSGSQPIYALTSVVSHKGQIKEDLFQFELKLELMGGEFHSTSTSFDSKILNLEEQETNFLFRHVKSYATGHGISVTWQENELGIVNKVYTQSIPMFYRETISTGIPGIKLNMMSLHNDSDLLVQNNLRSLLSGYRRWIKENEEEISKLPADQQEIARRLVEKCSNISKRIERGIELLFAPGNEKILEAFRLMNKAMFLQQRNGKIEKREFKDKRGEKLVFDPIKYPSEDTYGTWRPFQIGFLLMTIPGLIDPHHEDRDVVDLIFFPTGGGKTEAYLGAAALLIIYRRLENPKHTGVDVLMRYTLRLLTVQQFERSSGLIVALEYLRRQDPEKLGFEPISIGVWLGDKTTPNKRKKALEILDGRNEKEEAVEPFVLRKCPWCGAAFAMRISNKTWVGYKKGTVDPKTLRFVCGDESCDFSRESRALPIWITDEDVYEFRPSFILGTVDKFAQISWESSSRAIFNIDSNGDRNGLPPGLIIQDELHLISGPLGSLVGLYETVIDEMCSYESEGKKIQAKIIASTATTNNFKMQIRSLYARQDVTLFPQAVSRTNETFFSQVERDESNNIKHDSLYLGINAATYATGQLAASQVSAFLSQAPNAWQGNENSVDYYSTSMWFFNSLKELGQTLTLMQSTVISLLNQMWRDRRLPNQKERTLEPIMELTGRVSSAQVSRALSELEIPATKKGSIRTCLASSIMEVGVDVQRLGLLTIMSQPKLTAQYIQVAGRVGRAGERGQGLIVMLYNSSRARDRGVYENFRFFHEKLYAKVEPLSVTPFAIQTMNKGLWGAIIALYRMKIPENQKPTDLNESIYDEVCSIFRNRIAILQSSAARKEDFEKQALKLKQLWLLYKPTNWVYGYKQEKGDDESTSTALLRRRAEPMTHIPGDMSINIPQSMRSVDGQTDIYPAANVYGFLGQDLD